MSINGYEDVLEAIHNAYEKRRKKSEEPTLICVSKTFSVEEIRPIIDKGCRVFGENRVQEAQAKWPELLVKTSDVKLHLIGPLQSNKCQQAVALFDAVHTIDREKIAAAISIEMEKQQKQLQLFVQVNTGQEAQKSGIAPDECRAFIALCREKYHLKIDGLMCIPPFDENPGPHFALLAKLAEQNHCPNLSMGMSSDFEMAIEFGATHVRVGSAIFGAR